jgi:pilus assembly protein CpaB
MNKKSNSVVVGGAIVALLGMLMVFVYTRSVASGSSGIIGSSGNAFVVTNDVPVGTRWEDMANLVKKQDVPSNIKPATAVVTETQLNGRSTTQAISKGSIVTTQQFNTSASGGLDIPVGQNAVTINLGIPQGVARYIQAGAITNVYATFKALPNAQPADAIITKLILSNVKVLANQPAVTDLEKQSATTVAAGNGEIILTLAVTPDQAEKLIFAKENGSLWFGLVNPANPPVTSGGRTFKTALV